MKRKLSNMSILFVCLLTSWIALSATANAAEFNDFAEQKWLEETESSWNEYVSAVRGGGNPFWRGVFT